MTMTLDEIALSLKEIPDKSSLSHGYTENYARHFEPFRNKAIRLLEVGVWNGYSLLLWHEYFPKGKIVGADIDLSRCVVKEDPPRLRLWEVDQRSRVSLENMALELGPWSIIIDDGSHDAKHQRITFDALWPYLNAGGLYCIEDLHVNYFPGYTDAMVRFIGGQLIDDVMARGKLPVGKLENNSLKDRDKLMSMERQVGAIHLYRHLAIIEKQL